MNEINKKSLNYIFGSLQKSTFDFFKKPQLTAAEIKKAKKLFEEGNVKALDAAAKSKNSDLLRAMAEADHSNMQTKHWAAIFAHSFSDRRWSKETKKDLFKGAGNRIYNDPEFFEHLKGTPNGMDRALQHPQVSAHLRPQDIDYMVDNYPNLHSKLIDNPGISKPQLKKILDKNDEEYIARRLLEKHPDLKEYAAFNQNPKAQHGYLSFFLGRRSDEYAIPDHIFDHLNASQNQDVLTYLSNASQASPNHAQKFIESHIEDPAFEEYGQHAINAITPDNPVWNTVMSHAKTKPYLISHLNDLALPHVPADLRKQTIAGMNEDQLSSLLSNNISSDDIDQVLKNKNLTSNILYRTVQQTLTPQQSHSIAQKIGAEGEYRNNSIAHNILSQKDLLPETFHELKNKSFHTSSSEKFFQHKDLPREILDEYLHHKDPENRAIAALSPKLSEDDLTKLTKDKNKLVRLAVAKNPNLDHAKHLTTLLSDRVQEVKDAAIGHPNVHWGVLDNYWQANKDKMGYDYKDKFLRHPNLPLSVIKDAVENDNNPLYRFEDHPQYNNLVDHILQNSTDSGLLERIVANKDHSLGQMKQALDRLRRLPYANEDDRRIRGINADHPLINEIHDYYADHVSDFYSTALERDGVSKELFDSLLNSAKTKNKLSENSGHFINHPQSSNEQVAEIINSTPLKDLRIYDPTKLNNKNYDLVMSKVKNSLSGNNPDEETSESLRQLNAYGISGHPQAGLYTPEFEKNAEQDSQHKEFYQKFLSNNNHVSDDYILKNLGDFDLHKVMTPELAEKIMNTKNLSSDTYRNETLAEYLPNAYQYAASKLHMSPKVAHNIIKYSKLTPDELNKLEELTHERIKDKAFGDMKDGERLLNAIKTRKEFAPNIKDELSSEQNKIDYSEAHDVVKPHTDITEIHIHPGVERLKHLKGLLLDQAGGDENKLLHKKALPGDGAGLPKELFNSQGYTSAAIFENHIKSLPKSKFLLSYDDWNSMQMHQHKPQLVMQLNTTDEMMKSLKDKGLYDMFKGIAESSYRSGHPVRNHTIGWARIDTSHPKHWHIDEVQSDFGQAAIHQINELKESNPREQKRILFDLGAHSADDAESKIKDIQSTVSGGFKTPNHAIHAAAHELARQKDIKTTSMDTLGDQIEQSKPKNPDKPSGFMIETYKNQPAKDGYKEGDKGSVMPGHESIYTKAQIRKLVKSFNKLVELANLYFKDSK